MTQDEIIEMGRQALSDAYGSGDMFKFLERFAKLVAQHEREACVRKIEEQIGWDMYDPESTAIKAIRARGYANDTSAERVDINGEHKHDY
jgi:hypothetical protein